MNEVATLTTGAASGPARAAGLKETKVVRGYPLVGTVVDVLREGPRFLTRIAGEHPGEIVGLRLGPKTIYLVTHPDHVQYVLQDAWRSFGKGAMWRPLRRFFGDGLVFSEGAS